MGQTDKRTDHDPGHDEFNDARWWLTPEEEEAAQIRSWELGKALAGTLKPRPKVIDLNDGGGRRGLSGGSRPKVEK